MNCTRKSFKLLIIAVALLLVSSITVTFCLWDDTSIKSLTANGGTSNFIDTVPPLPSAIAEGDRLTIDSIQYTVGYKGMVGAESFVTLYSDDVSGKGVPLIYDSRDNNHNYDGRKSSTHDQCEYKSEIFTGIETYYTTLASKTVTLNKTGVTYGTVSEYIVPHLDYKWNLWLPSVRELNLYNSGGIVSYDETLIEGIVQPVMSYFSTDELRAQYNNKSCWLRSPVTNNSKGAMLLHSTGILRTYTVINPLTVSRVALNLRV